MFIMELPNNFASNTFLSIIGWVDSLIYELVVIFTKGLLNVANTQIFSSGILDDFKNRIYVVLGIYMLFKLAFSFMSYVVDPDSLNDKQKGVSKIVTRSIVSIALLIFTPIIFTEALNAQGTFLAIVPRIVLGTQTPTVEQENEIAETIAASTLSTFLNYNYKCSDNDAYTNSFPSADNDFATVDSVIDSIRTDCSASKSKYKYNYSIFISAIVGIALVFFIVSYAIDVGIRSIKLGILQLMAPIPIISYIDPKSGKDGAFNAWVKECGKTYIELFLKMGIFYFIIFLLSEIVGSESLLSNPNISGVEMAYVKLIIIIALFVFMGQAMPFIYKILGMKYEKGSGLFSGLGKIAAVAGIGIGGISAGLSSFRSSASADAVNGNNRNLAKNIGAGILGAGAGVALGAKTVANSKNIGIGEVNQAIAKRNADVQSKGAIGSTTLGRTFANTTQAFTGQTYADKVDRELAGEKKQLDLLSSIYKTAEDKVATNFDTFGTGNFKGNNISGNYAQFMANWKAASDQGNSSLNWNGANINLEEAGGYADALKKANVSDYIATFGGGRKSNGDINEDKINLDFKAAIDEFDIKGGISYIDDSNITHTLSSIKNEVDSATSKNTNEIRNVFKTTIDNSTAYQRSRKTSKKYLDSDTNRKVIKNK